MKSTAPLVLLYCLCWTASFGQNTSGGLAVPRYDDSGPVDQLIRKAGNAPSDSIKVNLLLQLSSIFWYQGKAGNLDTMLEYSRQAFALSKRLALETGMAESVFLQAKALTERNDLPAATRLLPHVYGEQQVRLLLVIAEMFVNRHPIDTAYLDRAFPYITKGLRLSDSIHSTRWQYESLLLMGKCYFERGDIDKGKDAFMQVITDCQRSGDQAKEAHYWSELDKYMPRTNATYADHAMAARKAYATFLKAGKKDEALSALRDGALSELWYDHLDTAEQQFKRVLAMYEELKKKPSANTLAALAELYLHRNEFAKCLGYALQGLNSLKASQQRLRFAFNYILTESYSQLGQVSNQLLYGQTCLDLAVRNKFPDMYYMTRYIVEARIRQDSALRAYEFLAQFTKEHPPVSPQEEQPIAYDFGLVYDHLGQFARAEEYYREMIRLDPAAQKELKQTVLATLYFSTYDASVAIGKFYLGRRRYREAHPYLLAALSDSSIGKQVLDRKSIELMLFRVDSALGNFKSAIAHYSHYTAINDSLFNADKVRQFEELQLRYQTRQNQQSIQLLQSQAREEQARTGEANYQRNITLGGIAFVLVIAGFIFRSYQIKRRNLDQLSRQQQQIYQQNLALQQLIGEKDRLLTDKDLLMQEVHHRVKNNLHLIISLLESQSYYLNNPAAQAALQETQNRIKAISLLHQKLYNAGVTTVNMPSYILELVSYLSETFHTDKSQIAITHTIEPFSLDVSEALPIGVILNEAFTNSIKHAFPHRSQGEINISLRATKTGSVCLRIKDDGVGLPPGFNIDHQDSLGLILIKGLSTQLKGRFSIDSDCNGGVRITVEFTPQYNAWPAEFTDSMLKNNLIL